MNRCYYCKQIQQADPGYIPRPAEFDVGSDCPRCPRHWRYECQRCGKASHCHGTFFCPTEKQFVCHECAAGQSETLTEFWGWTYFFMYRCPLCAEQHPTLDYAEYLGEHPYQIRPDWETTYHGLSHDLTLPRLTFSQPSTIPSDELTDAIVSASWDEKAELWDQHYDQEGDQNRKYQSDEVLLRLLGDLEGKHVLDAGSGQGYLCRILARRGATVVGVENSLRFYHLALRYQSEEPLRITYHHGSISDMPWLHDASFEAIVSNYVLMDLLDYEGAVAEFARVLKPRGVAVVVISHPCFHPPGSTWLRIPPDSLRREERARWMVDNYFQRRAWREHWGPFDTAFIGFHRPLSDYYRLFQSAGLHVTALEEPSVTERGKRELPPHYVRHLLRIPYSVAFRLERS